MVRGEPAEALVLAHFEAHRAVRDPDALAIEIDLASRRLAGGLLRTGAREERPVKHRQLRMARRVGNGDGEEARILVVHVIERDATVRSKRREPETPPVDEILRLGQSNPRSSGGERRVGHDVAMDGFDERDARVFAATAAVGSSLVVGLGFECDAEPFDACGIACVVEPDARDTDA